MVVCSNRNVAQFFRMSVRGLRGHNDSLTYNRGTFTNDPAFDFAVIGAPQLTPLTTTLKLSFALFEKEMVACRNDIREI